MLTIIKSVIKGICVVPRLWYSCHWEKKHESIKLNSKVIEENFFSNFSLFR